MSILYINNGSEYKRWNSGANTFEMYARLRERNINVQVQCRFGEEVTEYALLDTGAYWSILDKDTLEMIGIYDPKKNKNEKYITSEGKIYGYLDRLNFFILSNADWGEDLYVDSIFFITDEWEGPNVIGYKGMLDHIKFALQPSTKFYPDNIFLFAPSE